jgi:hypothetical protein
MACGVFKWPGVRLVRTAGLAHLVAATRLGTIPILFAWLVVAKLLGSIFADQHHWPPIVIAAFAHGLFLAFLCWVADLAIRRFVSDEATVRLNGLALLVTLYAGLLFFAWPLEDCP